MPRDTMTFILDGNVSLANFETAVRAFRETVDALSREVAPAGHINWVVDVLETGSTMLGVRGESPDAAEVERVVDAFEAVGSALERSDPIPYSQAVDVPMRRMLAVLNGDIPRVRFETPERDFTIESAPELRRPVAPASGRGVAYGAVRGRIQTLSSRNHLRFTLYDRVDGRAVSCWLRDGQQDLMRNVWDKYASVEGRVTRDSIGRPTTVRDLTAVHVLPEPRGDWRRAAGSLNWRPGDEPAEVTIRRFRDG